MAFLAIALSAISAFSAPVWQRLETEEFDIISDASANDIIEFAVGYTAFRHAFHEILAPDGRKAPRSSIILFRRGSALRKYGPKVEDGENELLTFTTQVDDKAFLAMSIAGNRRQALRIAYEFETVWAIQRVGYIVPIWMAQGTGMVLASLDFKKGKCIIGDQSEELEEAFLGNGDQLAWEQFFQISRGSDEYTGKEKAGVYQTQSWALMHWLLLGKKNPRESFEALAALHRKMPDIEAVKNFSGMQPKDFTKAMIQHLKGDEGTYVLPFDEAKTRSGLVIKPAAEAEVHVQLANLLMAAGRHEEAKKELAQAVALTADVSYVKEAQARLAIYEKRNDGALKFYRGAIEIGSSNASAYLYSASARLDEFSSSGIDYAGGGGPSTELALIEIRRALILNPGGSEGFRLLGRAFYILPKIGEENIAELSFGVTSGEAGCRVRFYRALLYQRLGKMDDCIQDLKAIIDDPSASVRSRRSAQDRLAKVTR